jgi:hypothetical protein
MIFPGGRSPRRSWIALAALALLACLIFVFYEAATRPAHSTPPKSQPLYDSR